MRTIQPKILEIPGAKLKGKKTAGILGTRGFSPGAAGIFDVSVGHTSRGPPLFQNFGTTRCQKLPKIHTGLFG